ncbi:hypothetical protein BABINDRAFT_161333 [Babjeviella inositovora NRRL Y-12698]|uniref:Post-GPI attachment to proteins factor 3 n=1 Tax=Babjeviella inositovora NRRL Y-12698 TaxID=984486 RepID=A0A1E3QRP9_9ASCO|nr:uncharacterized protein BABINDRAFT_161333 [Babjeviella inositovora NRRL Y-12698]ODQ80386.1 hypothetical protein BABINDRAFT_161333 [Babjeviella inositovora NRRL Y-12698]
MRLNILIILFSILTTLGECSRGDRLPRFQECLSSCIASLCDPTLETLHSHAFTPLNPLHRLLLWDCESDCNYQCRRIVTQELKQAHLPVEQFYGKWPFIRVLGTQELFSVVFSLANLYVNYKAFQTVQSYKKSLESGAAAAAMASQYLTLILTSCAGWLASTVFHVRDFALTETLDYFLATGIILNQLLVISIRIFELYKKENARVLFRVQVCAVVWYLFHCIKLLHFWDYQYNTNVSVVTGLATNILWTVHSVRTYRKAKKDTTLNSALIPYENSVLVKLAAIGVKAFPVRYLGLVPIFMNLWIFAGMAFELFDFPPWFDLVDGHAMWHLVTFFPPIVWYDWNIWDLQLERTDELGRSK